MAKKGEMRGRSEEVAAEEVSPNVLPMAHLDPNEP